jgi:hypothetical protein
MRPPMLKLTKLNVYFSLRARLFPFILRNWNLINGVGYFLNVTLHNFPKCIYKSISNSWGERWKLIL